MKTLIKSLLISFIGLGIVGCSDSVMDANSFEVASSKNANNSAPTPNIVTVASELDDFSILVDAVVFADLAGTLSG